MTQGHYTSHPICYFEVKPEISRECHSNVGGEFNAGEQLEPSLHFECWLKDRYAETCALSGGHIILQTLVVFACQDCFPIIE